MPFKSKLAITEINEPENLVLYCSWTTNEDSGLYYKSFTIIIYDHNDNCLYYKTTIVANLTMIIANLALARSINYDHKVCCKLKRTFTIVNYGPKPFIVQDKRLYLSFKRVNEIYQLFLVISVSIFKEI